MAQDQKDLKAQIALQEQQNKKVKETTSLINQQNSSLKAATTNWEKSGKAAKGYLQLQEDIQKNIAKNTKLQISQEKEQRRISQGVLIDLTTRIKESKKLTKEYGKTGVQVGKTWDPKVIETFNNITSDYSDRLLNDQLDLNDVRAQGLVTALDMYDDVLANATNIGDEEFKVIDVNKILAGLKKNMAKEDDARHVARMGQEIAILESAKAQNLAMKAQHDILTTTEDKFDSMQKGLVGMLGKIPVFGDMIAKNMAPKLEKLTEGMKKNFMDGFKSGGKEGEGMAGKVGAKLKALGPIGMTAIGIVIAAIAKMVLSMAKFANETGLSYKQTLKLGGALAINAEGVEALTEEFGNINNITTMMAVDMKILNKQYGISAKASAQILKLQTATSGMSNRQLLNVQKETAQMARLEGVSPAAVFESMAADSEAFAKFTKDSGKNLMQAAIQAKKLGLEMSAITGAAEGLLNLEDSLTKQMEASVLLGRDINLDRARSLALAGDISGVQQEIVKAVGGENEWNSMNLIQRKALADAVGLQVSEVSKVVGAQNKLNQATEEGGKQQWGMIAKSAALGALLIGIIVAAISAATLGTATLPAIGAAAAGFAGGAAVGAAGGAIVGGVMQSYQSAEPKGISGATMNPGTVANVRRGEMSIHAGESAVRTQDFNMAPMVEELKAMRKEMRVGSVERADQSRQQINTIKGIGAVQA